MSLTSETYTRRDLFCAPAETAIDFDRLFYDLASDR